MIRTRLTQGGGFDSVIVDPFSTVPLIAKGGDGFDLLIGGSGDDTLLGQDGDDALFGDGWDLSVSAMERMGVDLTLGFGYWTVPGSAQPVGAGNDFLEGGSGYNILVGGSGDDRLFGGDDGNLLIGDAAINVDLKIRHYLTDGVLPGSSRFRSMGSGNDIIHGGNGLDIIIGGDGDDQIVESDGFNFAAGDGLAFTLGQEFDLVANARFALNHPLVAGMALSFFLHKVALTGTGKDEYFGGAGTDYVWGGDGDDTINGGAASDVLIGGPGDDIVDGHLDTKLASAAIRRGHRPGRQ